MYWVQGLENNPDIVKMCVDKLRKILKAVI